MLTELRERAAGNYRFKELGDITENRQMEFEYLNSKYQITLAERKQKNVIL